MNKFYKHIIYPIVFSIAFLVFWNLLVTIINLSDVDDYGGLGLGIFILLVWIIVIIPIYCIRYSKIVIDEKLKFLFSAYNCIALSVGHILPFNLQDDIGVAVIFFVWVMFWNVLPIFIRLLSRKNAGKILKKDDVHLINFLLQNKKLNIIAICFTCIYIINCLMDSMAWRIFHIEYFLVYTLPLISAVVFLVLLLSKNKEYFLKKWQLSFALGGELVSTLSSILFGLSNLDTQLKYIPMYPLKLTLSCLMLVSITVMFIGTLFNFKYINLLKYGALGRALLSIGSINMLYFVGIFILTTNKKTDEALNQITEP